MAAIDFPNSPTINQQVYKGGYLWQWNGIAWKKVVTGVESVPYGNIDGGKSDTNFGGTITFIQGGSAGSF